MIYNVKDKEFENILQGRMKAICVYKARKFHVGDIVFPREIVCSDGIDFNTGKALELKVTHVLDGEDWPIGLYGNCCMLSFEIVKECYLEELM